MMKFFSRRLIAAAAALSLLGATVPAAFAAEELGIAVQLDGENMTFTDAAPQVKDQRTFLPFRAVFEAMGADVSNEGNVITAVRDGRTVTMTIGSTEATVTENGTATPLTMDVVPYVDNNTWRTYVPVRFAAQAMGCAVGWDQENSTVLLMDTDKMVADAKAGKTFTWLEKYMAYAQKYNEGIWDMTLDMDGSMSLMGAEIPLAATASGTTEGNSKMALDMGMTMDMMPFVAAMTAMSEAMGGEVTELSAEDKAMFEALATDGIRMAMRGDLAEGTFYMNMSGDFLTAAGLDPNTWYSMDLNSTYEQMGMDYTELMAMSKNFDVDRLIALLLSAAEPTSVEDYTEISAVLNSIFGLLSDASFVADSDQQVVSFGLDQLIAALGVEDLDLGNITADLTLALDTKNGDMVGYAMSCEFAYTDEESGMALGMTLTTAVDADDQMTANVAMDLGGMMGMELNMTGGYTKGGKAPETEPPAGATVVPFEEMSGGMMDGLPA